MADVTTLGWEHSQRLLRSRDCRMMSRLETRSLPDIGSCFMEVRLERRNDDAEEVCNVYEKSR